MFRNYLISCWWRHPGSTPCTHQLESALLVGLLQLSELLYTCSLKWYSDGSARYYIHVEVTGLS